jgi:hypothetical protein
MTETHYWRLRACCSTRQLSSRLRIQRQAADACVAGARTRAWRACVSTRAVHAAVSGGRAEAVRSSAARGPRPPAEHAAPRHDPRVQGRHHLHPEAHAIGEPRVSVCRVSVSRVSLVQGSGFREVQPVWSNRSARLGRSGTDFSIGEIHHAPLGRCYAPLGNTLRPHWECIAVLGSPRGLL